MASEETASTNGRSDIQGTLAAYISRLSAPSARTTTITVLFFVVTLVAYYLTKGLTTAANAPVRLADAILHGRLDVANGSELGWIDWAFFEGKYYVLEPPAMAIVQLPGVLLFGIDLNQTLVSIVIASLAVAAVYRLMAGLTEKLSVQIWMTVMFGFGTIFWWMSTQGGTWYFAHALSVLFLFVAIHETLVRKRPFAAGFFLGAAYLSRLPVILSFPFFFIMFSDMWLPEYSWQSLRESIRLGPAAFAKSLREHVKLQPLVLLGLGVGIPLLFSFVYNYLRFDSPFNTGYSVWADLDGVGLGQGPKDIMQSGLFSTDYLSRSVTVFFQAVPVFNVSPHNSAAPYVYPSWSGLAFWVTTPAFLYALFAGVKNRLVIIAGAAGLAVSILVLIFAARGLGWFGFAYDAANVHYWPRLSALNDFLYDFSIYPFLLLAAYGFLVVGLRNKLVLACWLAIIPIAAVHFLYPITGWPMFGYRYAIDYYPFLFLLTWLGMRDTIKWHHALLILAGVVVSGAGVLWINIFDVHSTGGLRWANW